MIRSCFLTALMLCFGAAALQAQVQSNARDSLLIEPLFSQGFDKNANTIVFNGLLRGSIPTFIADDAWFLFDLRYRANTIRGFNTSVRDDAEALLEQRLGLAPEWFAFVSAGGLISDDSRSLTINKLLNGNLRSGLRYQSLDERIQAEAAAAAVYSEQLGIADRGSEYGGFLRGRGLKLDEFDVQFDALADLSQLSGERLNFTVGGDGEISRLFPEGAAISVVGEVEDSRRDFYTFVGSGSTAALETRKRNNWAVEAHAAFELSDDIDLDLRTAIRSEAIERFYGAAFQENSVTAVTRARDELRLDIEAIARGRWAGGLHSMGIFVNGRDESNSVTQRFDVNPSELTRLRESERQRDNSSTRSGLTLRSEWPVFGRDTVSASFSGIVLRYDTPSDENNDDRDELSLITALSFSHRHSDMLTSRVTLETQLEHLVFLRAERSAQNNWNRVIRLIPRVEITTRRFIARPTFEVLANFTSYDFENQIITSPSFSFRQVSYRDSLIWRLSSQEYLDLGIVTRYYERARFRWNSFSETPQDENVELFCRLLLFHTPNFSDPNGTQVGVGARVYSLSSSPAGTPLPGQETLRQSFAPETVIRFSAGPHTDLELRGWYEIEFDRGKEVRRFPNVFLQSTVRL